MIVMLVQTSPPEIPSGPEFFHEIRSAEATADDNDSRLRGIGNIEEIPAIARIFLNVLRAYLYHSNFL